MTAKTALTGETESEVTIEEVNRVLEVGRILLSVLTTEELDQLQQSLGSQVFKGMFALPLSSGSSSQVGNTSVT